MKTTANTIKAGDKVTGHALFNGAIVVSVDGPSRIQKNYWRVTVQTVSGKLEQISVKGSTR